MSKLRVVAGLVVIAAIGGYLFLDDIIAPRGGLQELTDEKLADPALGSHHGYAYLAEPSRTAPKERWWAIARPTRGDHVFFTNHTKEIRFVVCKTPENNRLTCDPVGR